MKRLLLALLLVAYALVALRPAWEQVRSARHARDYATYHYAVQEAFAGGDPYDTAALGRRGRDEGTRKGVHPFFYPPPFLLGMLWAVPLSLEAAYRAWFWMNQVLLAGVFVACWRWFRAPPLLLAFVAATFTPIPDNAKMGQANLAVLLLSTCGLWWTRGALVGAAAMAKMAPAAYLGWWAARRSWRPLVAACAVALALSVAALPLVPLDQQLRFYTKILPGFASGDYHGLQVPITLPANHSIPDLLNQWWPGPDGHTLSAVARRISTAVSVLSLAALSLLGLRRRDPLGEALVAGAFTVLLFLTPVYAYEHHMVALLLPIAAAGTALVCGRLGRWWWPVLIVAYAGLAWPLYWIRPAQEALPALRWVAQESKFFGAVALLGACAWGAWRSPPLAPGPPPGYQSAFR